MREPILRGAGPPGWGRLRGAPATVPYRVLHILDHSWPVLDGYGQRSRSIIAAQCRLGFQPSVITSPLHNLDDPRASDVQLDGVRYLRTPSERSVSWRAIRGRWPLMREVAVVRLLRRRIQSLLLAEEFDVVHAHSPALCGLAAQRAAHAFGIPFVYELRAFWEDAAVDQNKTLHGSLRYRIARSLETHVLRRADAVVAIARPILRDLEARKISPSKLFHIPNGVDVERFTPRPRDAALAAQLGVSNTPTLGFLGTMFPWEGVPWLVQAAAELRRRGVTFKLLLVGNGIDTSQVERAIRQENAAEYVTYLGRVPHEDVERFYSVIDVLVYPRRSLRLTELVTPLKPLEAMALGKAVLGSSVGGLRELIEPGVSGVLFEAENIQDFCRQAEHLLQDAKLRHSLGARARQKILEEKNWQSLAGRYDTVYKTAVENARLRA